MGILSLSSTLFQENFLTEELAKIDLLEKTGDPSHAYHEN